MGISAALFCPRFRRHIVQVRELPAEPGRGAGWQAQQCHCVRHQPGHARRRQGASQQVIHLL